MDPKITPVKPVRSPMLPMLPLTTEGKEKSCRQGATKRRQTIMVEKGGRNTQREWSKISRPIKRPKPSRRSLGVLIPEGRRYTVPCGESKREWTSRKGRGYRPVLVWFEEKDVLLHKLQANRGWGDCLHQFWQVGSPCQQTCKKPTTVGVLPGFVACVLIWNGQAANEIDSSDHRYLQLHFLNMADRD